MHTTPWLLATSLPHHRGAGTRIKRIYAQRMQTQYSGRYYMAFVLDPDGHNEFGLRVRGFVRKRPE